MGVWLSWRIACPEPWLAFLGVLARQTSPPHFGFSLSAGDCGQIRCQPAKQWCRNSAPCYFAPGFMPSFVRSAEMSAVRILAGGR